MDKELFSRLLHRPQDSHKYDFGHVLVIGGSPGMTGAPLLTAMAALRSGAGLVTIAAPQEIASALESRVLEAMTLSLPSSSKTASKILKKFIIERKVSVLAIGPGLKPDYLLLVREIIKTTVLPIVIDGGGLAALQKDLLNLGKDLILTPHTGEFARFFSEPLPKTRTDLKPIAEKFAKQHKLVLVLKGHPSFVAGPTGEIYTNDTGGPALATAGTGDILTGIIAAFRAQGLSSVEAAKAGVYIHGLAADIAAQIKTEPGLIASDIIEALPQAFKKLS